MDEKLKLKRRMGERHINEVLADVMTAVENSPCQTCKFRDRHGGIQPCKTCLRNGSRPYHLRVEGDPERG